jgi:hypothetical protein
LTNLTSFNVQNNQLTGGVPDVPSPSALLPRSSNLCPNRLTPSTNAAWDTATGSTPWSQQCS